ncbi:MAG: hypothetical protein P1T08_16280 [Acidimicrobiia bacterium]|nr:hypothetical protein [Acidimicrobiia bacterium]
MPNPTQQIFEWLAGAGLTSGQTADAVVTLGILEHDPTLLDDPDVAAAVRRRIEDAPDTVDWRAPQRSFEWVDPVGAAQMATGASGRIELSSDRFTAGCAYDWLRAIVEPERGYTGFLGAPPGRGPLDWRWPLRIGFMEDPASIGLRADLEVNLWWPELWTLGDAVDGCDVLLLPWSATEADLTDVAEPTAPGLVVALGPIDVETAEVSRVADRLALRTGAWGCHLADGPPSAAEWVNWLIEGLSHDEPLDRVLGRVNLMRTGRAGFTTMSDRLIRESRLSRVVEQFVRHLQQLEGFEIEVPVEVGQFLGGFTLGGPARAGDIGEQLGALFGGFGYVGETHEATGLALLMSAAGELPELEPMATASRGRPSDEGSSTRILNGAVRRGTGDHRLALSRGETYTLAVWIGEPTERSITADGAPPVPVPADDLTWPKDIGVVFVCEGNRRETQRATIALAEHGDSEPVEFSLEFAETGEAFGRIALVYQGRVLQTAVFRAAVVAANPSRIGRPVIEVEAIVRASFATLVQQEPFDLSVVVNQNDRGSKAATVIRDTGVTLRSVDGLTAERDQLIGLLTAVADDPDAFASMEAEDTLQLVFDLATIGEGMHQTFVTDHGIPAEFFEQGRLQIISAAPDSYLPVEVFYSRPAPTVVELCPDWKVSVLSGNCASCDALGEEDDLPVCLTGFWGVRFIVERHAHDPGFTELPGDYRLQAEPTSGRDQLNPFASVLWGMSANVSQADQDTLAARLAGGGFPVARAAGWDEFQDLAGAEERSMIFLLPHTDRLGVAAAMEIGGDELERVNQVGNRLGAGEEPKLAVLLGCETARPDIPFQGLVPRFRRAGVSVVVSTITTILGRHAVPVAVELLDLLAAGVEAPTEGVGDVLRQLRRKALADGYPMVLSVVAFGDADWRIAR